MLVEGVGLLEILELAVSLTGKGHEFIFGQHSFFGGEYLLAKVVESTDTTN
jgi:hypothetical protein